MMRAYNKGAQMGYLLQAWYRVELETKQGQAQRLTVNISNYGVEKMAKAAIKEFANVQGVGWWDEMLDASVEFPRREEEKPIRKTEAWLCDTVLKSIIKLKKQHPDAFMRVIEAYKEAGVLDTNDLMRLPNF